jgi:hypothetical protein
MHSTQRAYLQYLGVRARAFRIYREIAGGEIFKISGLLRALFKVISVFKNLEKLLVQVMTGSFASPLNIGTGRRWGSKKEALEYYVDPCTPIHAWGPRTPFVTFY